MFSVCLFFKLRILNLLDIYVYSYVYWIMYQFLLALKMGKYTQCESDL